MAVRTVLAASAAALIAISASAASAPARTVGGEDVVYRIRPDARMCPSPMCGGYWLTRVNARSTACFGGVRQPACYVAALALGSFSANTARHIRSAVDSGRVLLSGQFAHYSADGFPQLARLVVHSAWLATGPGTVAGTIRRVVDTGVRCITSPCFSLRATLVNGATTTRLSELDLERAGASAAAVRRANTLLMRGGILVAGPIRQVPDAGPAGTGRTLSADQLWLPV
jgi:hypothetical protein